MYLTGEPFAFAKTTSNFTHLAVPRRNNVKVSEAQLQPAGLRQPKGKQCLPDSKTLVRTVHILSQYEQGSSASATARHSNDSQKQVSIKTGARVPINQLGYD
jgi:hypothetical protein